MEGDTQSIAQCLIKLFSLSKPERETMEKNGRKLVERDYTWNQIGKRMLSVYEWVLNAGNQPDYVITD